MKSWMFEKLTAALSLTLLSAFVSSCAPESKNLSSYQNSTSNTESSNIVGGTLATADYQKQNGIVELVIMMNDQSAATCTGTLIAKNLVLTAAHCLASPGIANIAAVFTTDDTNAQKSDVRFVIDGAIHPDFQKGIIDQVTASTLSWNDIALVKLESDAPADFKLVRMPASATEVNLLAGSKVTLSGYGITNAIVRKIVLGKNGKPVLVKGKVKTVELPSVGSGVLRKIDNIIVKQISADKKEIMLDQSKSTGACHGDSGGPAFIAAADGTSIQVGVTSRGTEKLGNCNENAVYTSVAAHLGWISETGTKLLAKAIVTPVAVK
jgi:secreted trypsin-like serine protease